MARWRWKKILFFFQSLGADLAASKDQTRVTRNDILHGQNVAQGRDKYKTLKQIRQGNTKQRVDIFEAMWDESTAGQQLLSLLISHYEL